MKTLFVVILVFMISSVYPAPLYARSKPAWVKASKIAKKCLRQDDYDCAIREYNNAINLIPRREKGYSKIWNYTGLGMAYKAQGRFDIAESNFQKALSLANKHAGDDEVGGILARIAEIYSKWGDSKGVRKYLTLALEKLENSSDKKMLSVLHTNLGMILLKQGDYDKAAPHLSKSVEYAEAGSSLKRLSKAWNTLGKVYLKQKKYIEAEDAFRKGLKINESLGKDSYVANALYDIAKIRVATGDLDGAEKLINSSLQMNEEFGRTKDMADNLHLLGVINYEKNANKLAIDYFKRSIEIKNKLRETAQGTVRRSYLASQINSYNRLLDAYSAEKDPQGFFNVFEMSRARQLAETIGSSSTIAELSLQNFQKSIPVDAAVFMYSVTGKNRLRLLGIDKTHAVVKRLKFNNFTEYVNKKQTITIAASSINTTTERGFKSSSKKKMKKLPPIKNIMEAVSRYRTFLADPIDKYEKDRINISLGLNQLLIDGAETILSGKKRLIIIPDGPLALIPFETLLSANKKCLVEKYEIGYVQSAGVYALLSMRNKQNSDHSIIAFGGAGYSTRAKSGDENSNRGCDSDFLEDRIDKALKDKTSLSFAYSCLGLDSFTDLPGTTSEINEIGTIFKNSKLVSGEAVNEKTVRDLSKSGQFKRSEVIHFAVHGIAIPEYPELSALILSKPARDSSDASKNDDDGFLTAAEIGQLDIGAQFVNLSACETGLGALVKGEGVVGLTHAFLAAGAGGMSVSLWNVSDASAAVFMTEIYRKATGGEGYDMAMSRTKRDFIKGVFGDRFKKPYYWAPFVYYGK